MDPNLSKTLSDSASKRPFHQLKCTSGYAVSSLDIINHTWAEMIGKGDLCGGKMLSSGHQMSLDLLCEKVFGFWIY